MNVQEIYNHLFLGQKLEIAFSSPREAETFRCKLSSYKSTIDKNMVTMGMITQDEVMMLSCIPVDFSVKAMKEYQDSLPGMEEYYCIFELKKRAVTKSYKVRILTEEEEKDKRISADVS